jgi:hypothetical protein
VAWELVKPTRKTEGIIDLLARIPNYVRLEREREKKGEGEKEK